MKKPVLSDKVMILGVDGLDPRFCKKMIEEGKMPNLKKIIDRGSCREDLMLLGGHPTVTPPMWTTLSTGCYANVHGITDYNRQSPDRLDELMYNLDSKKCKAEQSWNVIAEAGYKTLVWHWPGCAWPPTSDNENLFVVDGSSPGALGMGTMQREDEFVLNADETIENLRVVPKGDLNVTEACATTDVELEGENAEGRFVRLIIDKTEGLAGSTALAPINEVESPIKPATGWANAPAGAKEFTLLFSNGFLRRPCLILKNEAGIYDKVELYKSKKETEPMVVMKVGELITNYIDDCVKNDVTIQVLRFMKLIRLKEDGTALRLYVSPAMEIEYDEVFHPKRIYREIVDNYGYPPPSSMIGAHDKELVTECTKKCWDYVVDWQAKSMKHIIDVEGISVVFSHMHNIDLQEHKWIAYLTDKGFNKLPEEDYLQFLVDVYEQTDIYLGHFVEYLDKGWTIIVTSDHAQVCPTYTTTQIGDPTGINIGVMRELGFTVMKKDEHGNDTREIDWSKTRAIASRAQHIYINLKGRWPTGIVEPEDQYELEEEIMTALYGYKHPVSGKRVIAVALRNRDAVLLGQGGPEAGDIIIWIAEGYNQDHGDGLSTGYGEKDTSVSPIFVAAGTGIKEGYKTDRYIRQVDVAPTVCTLLGVRMPAQCEGAPAYQIFTEEL